MRYSLGIAVLPQDKVKVTTTEFYLQYFWEMKQVTVLSKQEGKLSFLSIIAKTLSIPILFVGTFTTSHLHRDQTPAF